MLRPKFQFSRLTFRPLKAETCSYRAGCSHDGDVVRGNWGWGGWWVLTKPESGLYLQKTVFSVSA